MQIVSPGLDNFLSPSPTRVHSNPEEDNELTRECDLCPQAGEGAIKVTPFSLSRNGRDL